MGNAKKILSLFPFFKRRGPSITDSELELAREIQSHMLPSHFPFPKKLEVGTIYDAKVVRVIDGIGAIVEFLGGKDGMVHISELAWGRTERVEDVLNVGDETKVLCVEYNASDGKTRLSLKQTLDKPAGYVDRPPRLPRSGGDRGGPHRGPRR